MARGPHVVGHVDAHEVAVQRQTTGTRMHDRLVHGQRDIFRAVRDSHADRVPASARVLGADLPFGNSPEGVGDVVVRVTQDRNARMFRRCDLRLLAAVCGEIAPMARPSSATPRPPPVSSVMAERMNLALAAKHLASFDLYQTFLRIPILQSPHTSTATAVLMGKGRSQPRSQR